MTSKSVLVVFAAAVILSFFLFVSANAQTGRGAISGRVVDSAGAVLQGARVELQPRVASTVADGQGEFTISDLMPGDYTLTVKYIGFSSLTTKVTVTAGPGTQGDAPPKAASKHEENKVFTKPPPPKPQPLTPHPPPPTNFPPCP